MPRGAAVIRYEGPRGVSWKVKFCDADEQGTCSIDALVRSQRYARSDQAIEDWRHCLGL